MAKKQSSGFSLGSHPMMIVGILAILLVIPFTVLSALHPQSLLQHAQIPGTEVVMTGTPITGHVVATGTWPPAGCQPIKCEKSCPANNPNCCPTRYSCPTSVPPTPIPLAGLTPMPNGCYPMGIYELCPVPNSNPQECVEHPRCRDMTPQCGLPERIVPCDIESDSSDVEATSTPNPTQTPETTGTQTTPTNTPTPGGCLPRPSCLDQSPPCQLPQPPAGWCPPTNLPLSDNALTNIMVFLNTYIRHLLGIR